MAPFAATFTAVMFGCTGGAASAASKNLLPRLLVTHGPVKRS